MSFYTDPTYRTKVFHIVAPAASFGTATASATDGIASTNAAALPKYFQRTRINKIRMRCSVIPNANSTNYVASFLNGTNTFGTAVLTTATAGQWITGVITSSAAAVIADDVAPTITLTGTATASAAANGTWDIWFEEQQLWDTTVY